MPSIKELYKRLNDVKIDADSINLNTDGLESLLATTQADIALIKADIANAQSELGENAPSKAVQIGGYNLADNKIYPFNVDSNGIQKVEARPLQSSSTSITTFTETTSSTVLASDATRKGIVFYVSGAGSAFISLGSSATSTSEYSIVASENDIANISGYTGEITGLVTGNAVLHITELS